MANIQSCEAIHFSKDVLNKMFTYKDGQLFWKVNWGLKVKAGTRVGTFIKNKGYRRLYFKGKGIGEHRAIWIMHNGAIPIGYEIDHKDTNKSNNIISNLRLATRSQNGFNKAFKGNSSGYKGVTKLSGWLAHISVNGVNKNLGVHETAELAHEAYKKAAIKYYGEFANFN